MDASLAEKISWCKRFHNGEILSKKGLKFKRYLNAFCNETVLEIRIIKIGNWIITDEGIRWSGTPEVDYFISKDRLAETGTGDRAYMYDWLVHLVEKTWLKREDIYTGAFPIFCNCSWGQDDTTLTGF